MPFTVFFHTRVLHIMTSSSLSTSPESVLYRHHITLDSTLTFLNPFHTSKNLIHPKTLNLRSILMWWAPGVCRCLGTSWANLLSSYVWTNSSSSLNPLVGMRGMGRGMGLPLCSSNESRRSGYVPYTFFVFFFWGCLLRFYLSHLPLLPFGKRFATCTTYIHTYITATSVSGNLYP